MNERERALQRDLDARERLAHDPIYLIKQQRASGRVQPRLLRDLSVRVTPPELAALQCRSRGLTDQMAAEVLYKTVNTIKTQLRSARTKLGAKDTTQACCEAIRQGLIP